MPLRRTILLLAAASFFAAVPPARALQLGDTPAQVAARHGGGMEDRAKQTTTFMWTGWSLRVQFAHGRARSLTYKKVEPLSEADALTILSGHRSAGEWRRLPGDDDIQRLWMRDDGALAEWKAEAPYLLVLEAADSPRARELSGEKPMVLHTTPAAAERKPAVVEAAPEALIDEPLAREEEAPQEASVATLRQEPAPSPAPPEAIAPVPAPAEPLSAAQNTSTRWAPWAIGGAFLLAAAAFSRSRPRDELARRTNPPPAAPAGASPMDVQLLHSLTSAEFEFLIAELHRRDGYDVELPLAAGTDEDIDLVLERDAERTLVQCRYWKSQKVSLATVRTFHEAMKLAGVRRGLLVTTGEFAREAAEYTTRRPLKLINGKTLTRLLQKHHRPGEQLQRPADWMEEFVAASRWIEPRCPRCESQMMLQKSADAGQRLWVCKTAPRCDGRRDARRDLLDCTPVPQPPRKREAAVIDV